MKASILEHKMISKKKKLEHLLITIHLWDKFEKNLEILKKNLDPTIHAKIKNVLKQEHARLSKALESF